MHSPEVFGFLGKTWESRSHIRAAYVVRKIAQAGQKRRWEKHGVVARGGFRFPRNATAAAPQPSSSSRIYISAGAEWQISLKKRPRDVSFAGIRSSATRLDTLDNTRRRDAKYTCIDEINNTPYRYRYLFVRCLSIFFFNRLIIRRWYLLVCISFKHLRVLA